jgi:hypothetical protein
MDAALAHRALDLTVDAVKSKRSIALSRSMAYHAELQHRIARLANRASMSSVRKVSATAGSVRKSISSSPS